ncbi:MAG: biotin/lipoyl-binding protein, partial [Oxalobacteraceae bacterium]
FLARAAGHADFIAGRVDTGFIERHANALIPSVEPSATILAAAAAAIVPSTTGDPWTTLRGFRGNADPSMEIEVEVAGKPYLVTDRPTKEATVADGVLFIDGEAWPFGPRQADHIGGGGEGDAAILSPMPGRVIAVLVETGQSVAKGERMLVLEAMKMEQALLAPFDGVVAELKVSEGAQVPEGTLLVRIDKGKS